MDNSTGYRIFLYFVVVAYLFYAMFGIGATGLFFSLAIALISFSLEFSNELSIAFLILSGLLWKFVVLGSKQGFQDLTTPAPTGTGDNLQAIVKKIQQVEQRGAFQPSGVLSSNLTEGFADVETKPNPTEKKEEKPKAATSAPAPVTAPTASDTLKAALPNPDTKKVTAGFTDNAMSGMFKLGSIPAEVAGGSHIDVGTTLMNAFNALKPDQVKQMTEDSQKLMETQKNLMGMLGTLKPMLQDGKQLMETFQEMFGNQVKV